MGEKEKKSLLKRFAEMNIAFRKAFFSLPCERTGAHVWEAGRKCHWCGKKEDEDERSE